MRIRGFLDAYVALTAIPIAAGRARSVGASIFLEGREFVSNTEVQFADLGIGAGDHGEPVYSQRGRDLTARKLQFDITDWSNSLVPLREPRMSRQGIGRYQAYPS
jgi:hypothetical protein